MIELRNVVKRYKEKTALDGVNLHIKKGELIVLKGVSGSGKSTLLSLVCALSKPTSGDVVVDGHSISKMADHFASDFRRENIGFVFQKYNLISGMSVWHNIALPLVPLDLSKNELEARIDAQLKHYGLMEYKEVDVVKLSGGQQQRVAIARAQINNPKIIIADEPTSNLDAALCKRFIEQLQEMHLEGKTIIVATHDPLFFELECVDRVIEIANGKIVS